MVSRERSISCSRPRDDSGPKTPIHSTAARTSTARLRRTWAITSPAGAESAVHFAFRAYEPVQTLPDVTYRKLEVSKLVAEVLAAVKRSDGRPGVGEAVYQVVFVFLPGFPVVDAEIINNGHIHHTGVMDERK